MNVQHLYTLRRKLLSQFVAIYMEVCGILDITFDIESDAEAYANPNVKHLLGFFDVYLPRVFASAVSRTPKPAKAVSEVALAFSSNGCADIIRIIDTTANLESTVSSILQACLEIANTIRAIGVADVGGMYSESYPNLAGVEASGSIDSAIKALESDSECLINVRSKSHSTLAHCRKIILDVTSPNLKGNLTVAYVYYTEENETGTTIIVNSDTVTYSEGTVFIGRSPNAVQQSSS